MGGIVHEDGAARKREHDMRAGVDLELLVLEDFAFELEAALEEDDPFADLQADATAGTKAGRTAGRPGGGLRIRSGAYASSSRRWALFAFGHHQQSSLHTSSLSGNEALRRMEELHPSGRSRRMGRNGRGGKFNPRRLRPAMSGLSGASMNLRNSETCRHVELPLRGQAVPIRFRFCAHLQPADGDRAAEGGLDRPLPEMLRSGRGARSGRWGLRGRRRRCAGGRRHGDEQGARGSGARSGCSPCRIRRRREGARQVAATAATTVAQGGSTAARSSACCSCSASGSERAPPIMEIDVEPVEQAAAASAVACSDAGAPPPLAERSDGDQEGIKRSASSWCCLLLAGLTFCVGYLLGKKTTPEPAAADRDDDPLRVLDRFSKGCSGATPGTSLRVLRVQTRAFLLHHLETTGVWFGSLLVLIVNCRRRCRGRRRISASRPARAVAGAASNEWL